MRKHIRFTALLLAVSLLFNTTLPVMAEGSLDTPTAVEETVSATEAAAVSSQETIAPSEETAAPSEENSVPTEETSVATVEASEPAAETTAPTEEISEPTEPSLPQPIAAGTVVCNSSVNIRSGPGTGYEILDFAYNGQRISIYEIVTTQEGDWGRIGEGRWICLTYVTLDGQEPTEETTAPTEEITAPTEEITAPTEEDTDPTEGTTAPAEETTAPTEGTTAPTEKTTGPTEESTDPTEETTTPTEEVTDPTEETTTPTEETTTPTEEVTDPTEETTAPTEETIDPLTELEVQLATISASIQFAEVVPEKMSLTWWAMNCSKMQTDLHLIAENMLAASPEGFVLPEGVIPQELLYQPENSTLYISSAKDLVYLSYVDPSEYQQMTLRLLPSQQENRGFYLIDPIDELQFSPLGSPEAPFRGKLIFHEQTGPIQLDCPLFDALSDEVKIEDLILECRAEEPMEGGLLAKWIAHTYGGAEWDVTLSAPEMEEDAVAYLPSLVGSLSSESDVTLTLTNESGLRVIGSGFLCAQMGMNAKFTVSGLSVLPTVTGYGENVGGLVGQMQAGSILLVSGESLALSQVTGPQDVGGVVGDADNPNFSLPAIVGVEGATICGQNVGALVGNLTLSNAEHAITQNASNLTLNGSANTGGLFGILCLKDATLSLTTSLDGLPFGEEALGSNGSIFGTFQASSLKNTLILNGEPINDRAGFEGLAGSTQSEDPVVTVEEVQQMMDQLASAELVPGGMSLTWWAVVCEKVTAEEIAAEINGTSLPSEETEPTQETTPATQEPEQTTATEPIVQNEAPEETTLPQDSPSREEYPDAQEDILSQEDVLLEEYVPMAAAFSLSSEGSATMFSMDGEDASTLTPEEDNSVTDVVQDENVPVLLEADETESEESNTENEIMLLTDVGGIDFDPAYLSIGSAADLVRLSYVAASDYQAKTLLITATTSAVNIHDVTGLVTVPDYGDLSFLGLGSEKAPFEGQLDFAQQSEDVKFKLNRPFFNYLADSATINVNLYASIDNSSTQSALLAGTVTHKESAPGSWNVKLWGNGNSYPLLGAMNDSVTAQVELTLNVGTFNGEQFTPNADYSALTVLGGGYLCETMGKSAALDVTLQAVEGTALSIPKVSGSGDAGSLVGTMGSSASLTVTLPADYDALPISNVTASENAGGVVGRMNTGSTVSVKKADSSPAKITTTGVTITGNNAGGLVGYMEGETTLTADWSSFTAPTVTATEYAGGLAGYAKDPGTIFQNISVTDATISGKKAGGLIGWLDNTSTASFTLNANVQDLTISGSESSGGLFGELHNDKGTEGAITYSISKTESSSISNITLTGKDADGNASGDAGGLIGKYYTNDLKNTLKIENISVTSSSSAKNYGGVIGKMDGSVAAYVEFSNVSSTSSEPSSTYFGGLIGWLSEAGHVVKIGANVTINATSSGYGSSGTGGLIGYMPNGVLFITGSSSPVLNYGTIINKNANTRGWILGNRGNTLVFTDILGWVAEKGSDTNDTGVWGQVLRVDSLTGLFDTGTTDEGTTKSISQYISENHFITISKISQETITDAQGTNITALAINNVVDFAKVALRLQLDETSSLKFAKVNDSDASGDLDTSGTITISLKASIDLNNTGLTGFTRDVNKDNTFSPVFNIQITGTLTEEFAPVITLPTLKVYTISGSHDRQGLIAKARTLTVTNLTLATTLGTDGVQTHLINNGNTYTGLLAAEASGNVTLNNVTSSAKLKITGSAGNNNSRAAGLIAQVTSDGTSLTFTNCTWNGLIQDEATGNDRCAGFLAYSDKKNTQYQFTGCFVKGTINKTEKVDYVSVGGLISALSSGTNITLNIDDLEVNGANITATGTNDSQRCGGLLGYEWFNVTATLSNITVTGSSLNAGNSNFGGLVYKGSGYWKIVKKDGENESGISFGSGNSFTGASPEGAPSGLFICHGDKVDDSITDSALYLEVLPEAYTVDPSVSVTIGTSNYFDELVGTSIGSGGNGIVSIATPDHAPIDLAACNTYKKQLSTDYDNPNTRYYYNLDKFRTEVNEDIDTPAEMVVLSARGHCHSGLQTYFTLGNNTITDTIDLSGYSYYPIPFSGQTIENATITFDYERLETAEGASTTDEGTIPENKKPSNPDRQHYEMHTGIFTDVGSESANASLTIGGLTLKGTVGGSAIIKGTARGKESTAMTTLKISNVKLDGIRIVTADESLLPLLINGIESFTSLALTDVTTTDAYQTLENFTHAATSLIGVVGETSGSNQVGQYIQLDFSQIALDGRITADSDNPLVHNTTSSIFSEALFLKEFQYADTNSWGIYNFTQIDEAKGAGYYTLGWELSNGETEENVRNGGEQFYFYGSTTDYVYCAVENITYDEGTAVAAASYFNQGNYRRYVGNKETGTKHEMDINLLSPNIIEGCGTYSHPYVITNGKQLLAVANVLKGLDPKKNWTITLNDTVKATILTSGFSSQSSHSTDNDKEYKWDGTKWIDEDGSDLDANADTGKAMMIAYLRNAYYQLKGTDDNNHEINLSSRSGWGGLGSKDNPFRGVIVGAASEDSVTVRINAPSATQFGGLIAFSEGSVVKGVTIQYDSAPTITCTSVPSTIDAPFFGGVVGWCIGGDTIIDGVTVAYATTDTGSVSPTITGAMAYLVPVGGYVGLVGGTEGLNDTTNGLGGGVVFRNISESKLPDIKVGSTSVTPSSVDSNYFYVNPYVGRVLDGYAIAEGSGFINTDKNYTIPSLSSPVLTFEDGKISISNNEGLWLLSAIVNSGAGSSTAKAYTSGKTRFCDYESVGGTFPEGGVPDETSGAAPYLIRKFRLADGFKTITASAVSIELTDNCDMTNYGNGFRGIGTSYSAYNNYNRLIKVVQLDGDNNTVTLAQSRKEYLDEGSNWTSIGTGLFVRLYQDSSSNQTTIKNLTLKGSTGITYYNGTNSDTNNSNGVLYKSIKDYNLYSTRLNQVGAGMLASSVANMGTTDLTIENVTLENVNVNSGEFCSVFAGGMIGVIWGGGSSNSSDYLTVTLKDCAYANLTVRGFVDAGGFIGRVRAEKSDKYAKIVITFSNNASLTGGDIATTSTTYERSSNFSTVGGLIGCTYYYDLAIQPQESTNAMLTISDLNVKSGYTGNTGDRVFGGGLVGLCYTPKTDCTIQNVKFTGTNTISGAKSGNRRQLLGGLIGTVTNSFGWNDGGNANVNVSSVHIAESGSLKLQYTQQAGALFGILNIGGQIQLSNITIGSEGNFSPSVMIANIKSDGSYANIGGLIGGGNALKDVSLNDVQINNTYVLLDNNSGKTRGASLLFGFIENGGDTARIQIQNLTLKSSYVVTGNQQTRAGFLYGFLNNQNSSAPAITGFNVLVENCRLGYNTSLAKDIDTNNFILPDLTTNGTAAGLIGGDCTDNHTSIKLVGVRVKDCTAPAQNFGTTAPKSDSYVIRADYSKAAFNASAITSVPSSTIRITETEESAAKVLTSDGACFTTTESTTPIAEQIMRDYYTGGDCNSYFSISSAITSFASKSEGAVTISERLSTFYITGELSEDDKKTIPNFPVLMINSNEGRDTNSIVQDFITVLTNDTVYSRSISAATYKWSINTETNVRAFTKTSTPSLTVASDGTVSIAPGAYDNRLNQFTLLDVQYADPTGGSNAYHLYIPVIVKKVLEFKFWAAAENGTTYKATNYDSLSLSAIGSSKDQITALLTFEYQRSQDEWQTAVNNGENLLWNFSKQLFLSNSGVNPLPNLQMTLVDRNDKNKAYYLESNTATVEFSKFTSVSDGSNWSASNVPLCDLLGLTFEPWSADAKNKYVLLDTNQENAIQQGATLRVGDKYYRLATDSDDGDNFFTIKVGPEGDYAQETYYLTLQTEVTGNTVYNFLIQCLDRLEKPIGIDGSDAVGMPTTRKNANGIGGCALHSGENRVVISNFFTQVVTVTTTSATLMSDMTNTILGTLETKITFASEDAQTAFTYFAGERNLYQCFRLYLRMVDREGNVTSVPFAAGTTLYSEPVGSESIHRLPTTITSWEGMDENTVRTDFKLEYTTQGIIDQFPTRITNTDKNGIQVWAESILSLDESALERSNLLEIGNDDQTFYRNDVGLATLSYNAYDDTLPTQASGLSKLGINGWDPSDTRISSVAGYNCSAVNGASSADTLTLDVQLYRKNDDGTYIEIPDYSSYVNLSKITAEVMGSGKLTTKAGNPFSFQLENFDGISPILIEIDLDVKTGSELEAIEEGYYANYKVKLTASLYNGKDLISHSQADDYIIYTNAKILSNLIS